MTHDATRKLLIATLSLLVTGAIVTATVTLSAPKHRSTNTPSASVGQPAGTRSTKSADETDAQRASHVAERFAEAYAAVQDARANPATWRILARLGSNELTNALRANPARANASTRSPLHLVQVAQVETSATSDRIVFEATYARAKRVVSTSTVEVGSNDVGAMRVVDVDGVLNEGV